jgi:uncharacterized protein (TIGR02246 family)
MLWIDYSHTCEEKTIMQDIRDAVTVAIRAFEAAIKSGDAAAIAALYSKDATLLPPDNPMMKGADAIEGFWQSAMNMGIKDGKLETLEIEARDDLAYEMGRFELTVQPENGESATLKGKYVVVWKVEGGNWRMHVDIWNTNGSA